MAYLANDIEDLVLLIYRKKRVAELSSARRAGLAYSDHGTANNFFLGCITFKIKYGHLVRWPVVTRAYNHTSTVGKYIDHQ